MKVFKKKKKIIFEFFKLFFACVLKLLSFNLTLDYNRYIYIM